MSVTATEFWRLSALELAGLIRSRQASSLEIVDAHLRRIEAVNPAINAVPVVLGEQALEAARTADRALAGGSDLPPFHGVPFTAKSNIDVAGSPTTHGTKAVADATRPGTRRSSSASRRRAGSRSAAPTCPTSPSAGTPTASCTARP
jgi:amidase